MKPHGLQHARLPCPSLLLRLCSNSCPSSWRGHPPISSSVIPCPSLLLRVCSNSCPSSQWCHLPISSSVIPCPSLLLTVCSNSCPSSRWCNCAVVWAFFGIAFLWDWNENYLFQSCGHCWVFQICWHSECNPLTASSFRIWNSSMGILSPPLALFLVMLPRAHLTSHFRMSGQLTFPLIVYQESLFSTSLPILLIYLRIAIVIVVRCYWNWGGLCGVFPRIDNPWCPQLLFV